MNESSKKKKKLQKHTLVLHTWIHRRKTKTKKLLTHICSFAWLKSKCCHKHIKKSVILNDNSSSKHSATNPLIAELAFNLAN